MSEVPVHRQRCEDTLFTPIVADDERGARVGDGRALCDHVASADRHHVEVELPVRAARHGHVVDGARVVLRVDAAEHQHASLVGRLGQAARWRGLQIHTPGGGGPERRVPARRRCA